MLVTLNIPNDLLSEVQNITGEKSKTKAIIIAMEEFIRQKRLRLLLELQGKINIQDFTQESEELELGENRTACGNTQVKRHNPSIK